MWASRRIEMPGEGCTSVPMVKPEWSFVCLPCTSSWGAPRVKMSGDENPSKFFFFHDPLVEKKLGPEAMPKFLIVVWPICSVTVLWGTDWVPWCIGYGYNISVVLFSCFKKFKCLGDVLASVSLPEFAKLRSQLLDVFINSSDFNLAQHFSCSVKTVECGQLFILACAQLWKKAQHNFIGQF